MHLACRIAATDWHSYSHHVLLLPPHGNNESASQGRYNDETSSKMRSQQYTAGRSGLSGCWRLRMNQYRLRFRRFTGKNDIKVIDGRFMEVNLAAGAMPG
jgi:hypothetical protein